MSLAGRIVSVTVDSGMWRGSGCWTMMPATSRSSLSASSCGPQLVGGRAAAAARLRDSARPLRRRSARSAERRRSTRARGRPSPPPALGYSRTDARRLAPGARTFARISAASERPSSTRAPAARFDRRHFGRDSGDRQACSASRKVPRPTYWLTLANVRSTSRSSSLSSTFVTPRVILVTDHRQVDQHVRRRPVRCCGSQPTGYLEVARRVEVAAAGHWPRLPQAADALSRTTAIGASVDSRAATLRRSTRVPPVARACRAASCAPRQSLA